MTSCSDSGSSGTDEHSYSFDELVHPLVTEAGASTCDNDPREASFVTTQTEPGDGVSGLREGMRGSGDRDRADCEERRVEEADKDDRAEKGWPAGDGGSELRERMRASSHRDRACCEERRVEEAGKDDRAEKGKATDDERQPVLFESLLSVGKAKTLDGAW